MAEAFKTVFLSETDSTNNYAKRYIAEQKEDDAVLFLAERQTTGRGRQGKSFFSPEGGLYMTLLLPAAFAPQGGLSLTAAAGVAVCDVLGDLGIETGIKWVNDIYWQGKKLCGILCENIYDKELRPRYIVGIGINLQTPSDGFPSEIADRTIALDMDISASQLSMLIVGRLLELIAQGLESRILYERYKELSFILKKRIIYVENGTENSAQVLDINTDGSLCVLTENGIITLSGGEISLLI